MDGFEVLGLRLDLVMLPIAWIALAVVAVVLLMIGSKVDESAYGDGFGWQVGGVLAAVFAAIVLIVHMAMLLPFQAQYHHWYSTTGEVTSVTNVFEGGSGEVSPGYVVEIDSADAPLVFTDPRVLSAQGEDMRVTCSLEWVPAGADRLNCWIAG